ncbi:MAG: nitrogenase component 1 [Elusimicrobiota bacterium]
MSRIRGHRINFPSLMGAYLAVNAVPDSTILVDGPDCALYKAHFIHGRHDLKSTLLSIEGKHRVCFTNVCAQSVTKDHNELIVRRLRLLNEMENVKIVLVTSLPGCSITGLDYDHLVRMVMPLIKEDALAIPPTSLMGDWLDGYAVTLRALARHMDLSGGKPKPGSVALVGYFMDRHEGDHNGNLQELKRLLEALGLKLVSVWLNGDPYAKLREVRDASIVVSLPYGREAAAEVAKKTKAKLVETALPFGMTGTERFLLDVAKAAGKTREAKALIASEQAAVFERLEWIVPYLFLHKEATFIGDPFLKEGFLSICEDLGIQVRQCILTARDREGKKDEEPVTLYEPDIYHPVVQDFLAKPTELVVTNTNEITRVIRWSDIAIVELGFPSYYHHALADAPFLGFRGMLAFTERMGDGLAFMRRTTQLRDLARAGNREGPPPPGWQEDDFSHLAQKQKSA